MSEKHKKAAGAAHRYQKDKMACNKPQRAPKGDKHKYVVKACDKGREGIVRFGYVDMTTTYLTKTREDVLTSRHATTVPRRKTN